MKSLKMYRINAFTGDGFGGNPAAVLPLEAWLENAQMQTIAAKINLSETAFFVPEGDDFRLRWFTPVQEVPLCGHATLAAAFVIFENDSLKNSIRFRTQCGDLTVTQSGGNLITLNFPRENPIECAAPIELLNGLGKIPYKVLATKNDPNYYAVYDNEIDIREMSPNLSLLERLHPFGVVVTAPGREVDFVSRYFAPSYGIPEDPATGSIHRALAPFWMNASGKLKLHARQLSKRGGEMFCECLDERVLISGRASKFLQAALYYETLFRNYVKTEVN
ncbi:MAG TPA: PhzF family phenazine biosynthesis protein [Pyrinomonadaceae bacterium]|jgi:PhzF family phenazine biosynthesis protein